MASTPDVVDEDAALAAEAALEVRHHHPSDRTYILVALALGVLTAIEVGLYYLKSNKSITVTLLVLMVIKFVIVAAFFMHLRFDSKIFRRLFMIGVFGASTLYTIVLFMFGVFHV